MNPSLPLTLGDEAAFDAAVIDSTLPVLVDFWAPWCGPCKMLAPLLDEIAREQEGVLRVVKVNVDESPDLAKRFNIRSIPTLLIFSEGKLKDTVVGLAGKKKLLEKAGIAVAA
jgi:thioredoxin 1